MILLLWIVVFQGQFLAHRDTVALEEVEVHATSIDRFAQGLKIKTWGKSDLARYPGRSLGDVLQESSPVFIRQYGAGMLASPSLRGTSAGHTAVFWNGLPINSPSLGQSDLSILPVVALDQVSLQFGNAGALFGNEAIGGSLHLDAIPVFGKGLEIGLVQQIGSFGLVNSSLNAGFSTDRVSVRSRFYREFSANDFPYKDLGQPGTPVTRQAHAKVEQLGYVQDIAWNIRSNQQLKSSFWWNRAERQIQPVMGSNTRDLQQDQSFRATVSYLHFSNKGLFHLNTGLVRDEQLFNRSENNTVQYFISGNWDRTLQERWIVKLGSRATVARGDLSTYREDDTRVELYQSTKFIAGENLAFSLNLRQLVYSGTLAPFSPGVGMDWNVWKTESQTLQLKSSVGRGFKVPTLNDRFWVPGGNPDLLPEESLNGEIGLSWTKSAKVDWEHSLTYYRMKVANWIIWLPQGSVWSPENIREVSNQGIEYEGKVHFRTGSWTWAVEGSYTFSRAIATKGVDETDQSVGKQLPYTPRHQSNARLTVGKGSFSSFLTTHRIGERSVTADNPRVMSAYQLFGVGVHYSKLAWGELRFPVGFQINNLMNTAYQVLYLRAMPGRSYQFNLSIYL